MSRPGSLEGDPGDGGVVPPPAGERRLARLAAMVTSYALGSFNENFFKEAAMLIAVAEGMAYLQGWATVVFAAPYLLAAAAAGWLADRFAKRRVLIACKLFEVAAMTGGAFALYTRNWPLLFVTGAAMALQSTIFSPSFNGLIPEVYPPRLVPRVNAVVKIVMATFILLGVGAAGPVLGFEDSHALGEKLGRLLLPGSLIVVALLGLVSSLGSPRRPAAGTTKRFPWTGPVATVRDLIAIRRDRLLTVALVANVFIWSVGSIQILILNELGLSELHYTKTLTGVLVVAQVAGFGIGGALSSLGWVRRRWHRVLSPAAFGLGIMMLSMPAVMILPASWRLVGLLAALCLSGLFGGLLMIPTESFIQVRPSAKRRGAVWAAANFAAFSGIFVSGPIYNLLSAYISPSWSYAAVGGLSLVAGVGLYWILGVARQEQGGLV